MKLRYHPAAEAELRAAVQFGERQRPGRGTALLNAAGAVERRLLQLPDAAPRWPGEARRELRKAIVPRTPYLLIYARFPDQLVIVAVAHMTQHPGYWRDRLAGISDSE